MAQAVGTGIQRIGHWWYKFIHDAPTWPTDWQYMDIGTVAVITGRCGNPTENGLRTISRGSLRVSIETRGLHPHPIRAGR
jgi:hypothetical protein